MHRILIVWCVVASIVGFGPSLSADDTPLNIGARKQLFIDQRFIAGSENVELRMIPPQKLGILRDPGGQPLQGHVSRVIEDQGKIRLYLGADSVRVWESDDAMQFRDTGNGFGGGIFPTIFLDPHETDSQKKYKLFRLESKTPFDPATDGVFALTSPDGVNFTRGERVFPFFTDNPTIVYWDERIGRYVIFLRALEYDNENQRRVARIETDDPLRPWPYTQTDHDRMFATPENLPVVLQADETTDPHSDIYYSAATIYPEAQDAYLMFVAPFRHFAPNRQPFIRPRQPGQWEDYGMLDIELAVSRDGIHWHRPSREPYVRFGLPDEWDRWLLTMGPGIVRRGNYLYQYYNSSGRLHDSVVLRPEYDDVATQIGGVGVVRQRLDGFVAAESDERGGWIETPPLVFTGRELQLNIDTGALGTAFVELRDAAGQPIPGFTRTDCEEIGGNFINQRVYWKGQADVSSLAGRPIRIYFSLKQTRLYAFQFVGD
jgi:hypothetical protein